MAHLPLIQKVKDRIAASLLLQRPHNAIISAVFLFCITQLGLHFWPPSSLVYGVRVDYLSPTLYLFDFLVLFTVLFLSFVNSRTLRFPNLLIPTILLNLVFTQNPLACLSWSLRLSLYLTLILSLNVSDFKKTLPTTLIWLSTIEVSLAIFQVIIGHNVGGIFYYLGERNLSLGQPGIALTTFFNQAILRGYGTFGHPNTLAGWLIISLLIFLLLNPTRSLRFAYLVIVTVGTLIAGSRAGGLSLFGIVIPALYLSSLKSRALYFVTIAVLVLSLGFLSPNRSDISFMERLKLEQATSIIIGNRPFFGSGVNASISLYPELVPGLRLLQPGHNSFTLFLSWFGVFGTLAILQTIPCTSSAKAREKCLQTLRSLGGLLPLLLFDHYFLTSPQGVFILILYLKLALNYSHVQKNR